MTTPLDKAANALHDYGCARSLDHNDGIDHANDWRPYAAAVIEALRVPEKSGVDPDVCRSHSDYQIECAKNVAYNQAIRDILGDPS